MSIARTWLGALTLALALVCTPTPAQAGDVAYRGRLMGPDGKPYFGIVRLGFSLHREAQGGKPLWGETRFVYVEEGSFLVRLGERASVPADLDPKGLFVAMSIPGGGEFFREPLKPIRIVSTSEFVALKESTEGKTTVVPARAPGAATGATTGPGVPYAEKAGVAYEAEHARTADRIENMTLKEIERALRERIKPNLGSGEAYADHVGGHGGTPFFAQCPKGYVVTGARGGAGKFVDGFQFVCAPIE